MQFKFKLAKILQPLLERLEGKLERRGNWRQAQILRLIQLNCEDPAESDIMLLALEYIRIGIKLRFYIQREVYLQAKHDILYEQLHVDPSSGNVSTWVTEMETYREERRSLLETIWNLEREMQRRMITMPDGILKRIFCAHQRRDNWYLSAWLRAECAKSGGCCGRKCGCCKKPRNNKRPDHRSHCTSACLCCEEVRGYTINIDNYENDPMITDIGVIGVDKISESYGTDWANAYILGIW
ncbi:hypothetical protein BO78DRAFT_326672 [Aspergillus sclerotiicarbonarius CBS 121057]|uniref:Uncharacterized protein n=1 Tax=Aspergillus sclerotiicarbonarius (strain CBS 121057 / IBT 28362) TaxID=1448318 RepID=A0A319EDF6_ASPSB|nr:hypothetical protein BO78DRAFT_326672 [Aspergillus sclerotiicarbonarius CBS 121057]